MIPTTPRGMRDVLPTEAAWRQAVNRSVSDAFASWGYVPIETPTLERLEALEMAGELSDKPFMFFDSDNNLLVLRSDCTLPVARLTALRLDNKKPPYRFNYSQHVFREHGGLYGEDREFTQLGIEFIGSTGLLADAEVISLLFDALDAAGLEDFTVALGTVGVLNALVEASGADQEWKSDMLSAFHASDFVTVDALSASDQVAPGVGNAIAKLIRIQGGLEAIQQCRQLVEPLGCQADLDELEAVYQLVCQGKSAGKLLVDFSIACSFDYYTGMVFKAYVPKMGRSIATGGRYDGTLEKFGRKEPAAGFAIGLERVVQALEAQGALPPEVGPEETVFGDDPQEVFEKAAALRSQGKRVAIGGAQ